VDFASCEFAYCSFVFALMTGFCIGAISLSNIIGVAYVNKRLSRTQLMYIAVFFEALGMMLISRYTLTQTITKTVNFQGITNLRTGFICLGSTQMCSALIMINILIFALPMSTTQVVISGLAAISLIYLPNANEDLSWFGWEVLMWILMPIVGLALSFLCRLLVHKHIF
jgi:phosphate/sulfate permease